ncbi:MAG TPA: FecR family protein [Terriglobia bacterium]|jgi:hypothetical protein
MHEDRKNPNVILDTAVRQMRDRTAPEAQAADSAGRVLEHLRAECAKVVPYPEADGAGSHRLSGCADFQALIPGYVSSSLTSSRMLLMEDHLHECVSCRSALAESQKRGDAPISDVETARGPHFRWLVRVVGLAAMAAVVLIAFQITPIHNLFWPIDVHAMVQTAEGGLYTASGPTVQPVAAGQRIERSQVVRTGDGARAVLDLADGSRIEMDAHSELWLDSARDGVRINVNRGKVIVTAAKQHGGHLYAATRDVGVSVVGTVFEVTAGIRGSRVTVIEGEVRVQQGATAKSLRPGQQFSAGAAMGAVTPAEEINWSREVGTYAALLNAVQDAAQNASPIETRHTSDLVPLVPGDTAVFASLPNISQPLAASYELFKQRVAQNPELAGWWQQKGNSSGLGPILDQIVNRLATVGSALGAEVVFAFPANSKTEAPVLLADTANPDQLAALLISAQARVARSAADVQTLASSSGVIFYVGDGLMIASTDAGQVLRSLQFRSQPSANPFLSTALYGKLVQAYNDGITWLLAADLQSLVGDTPSGVSQLLVEQKSGAGGAEYRAAVGFNHPRTGIAAWLAEPAPMGALEFISPAAYGVAGAVTKDAASMFDDVAAVLQKNLQTWQDFQNYQAEHRVDIRRDLAAALGNEFLIAIDGPVLPTPGWRIVVEVNDAARLQNTIEWTINDMNREAAATAPTAARQLPVLTLSSSTSGGYTFYSLKGGNLPVEIDYTYWSGYMIVAPSQAMLLEAIQNHDNGNSIARSASFRSQLPADGRDNASAFIYQNVQALTKSANTLPSLVAFYGEPDQIVMSSKGALGTNVGSIAGLTGMLDFAGFRNR